MSYACPYAEWLLEKWDSVANPIGCACGNCENYDCEHNPNPDPSMPYYDPYELPDKEVKE